ncbi:hypothetical protein Q9S36_34505 [Microbacterium sp. ARD31]|uniref:hypothetical protein n=1 Tax=Microbacterium sp. ARD31 TaxID=2962576 RepID=UPI002881078B|nr:hypothetical protein [Microbacterium sp. ARD31]MDT0185309.1 hypothetical protein [Microbacterium sp. ARD31]
MVDVVVLDLLVRVVHHVTEAGWPPADLAELVRRQLDERHLVTLCAALHDEGREHRRRDHAWVEAVNTIGAERPLVVGTADDLASALGWPHC